MGQQDQEQEKDSGAESGQRAELEHELARERKLERIERSQLIGVRRAIRLADFMAILMVIATGFSAYAAWRTAQVTGLVFAVSDRPFMGIESVKFEQRTTATPRVAVSFKNFGRIPALDAFVSVHSVIDGKLVKSADGDMTTMDTGVLSPGVSHYFYNYLAPELYQAVAAGKSKMQVHVRIYYQGPARTEQFCYFERIFYDQHSATFRAAGGSDRCTGTPVY